MKRLLPVLCVLSLALLGGCTSSSGVSGLVGTGGRVLPPCPGSLNKNTWTNCAGTEKRSNGQKYVGEWKGGLPHGQGTYTFRAPHKLAGEKYVGEFRNGKLHGQGTLTFSAPHKDAGEKYVGEWKDDKRHGQGTVTWSAPHEGAGEKYVGEYRDGKRNGQGTYTSAHGRVKGGIWENNKFLYAKKKPTTVTAQKELERLK
jgi:hypothetical protein